MARWSFVLVYILAASALFAYRMLRSNQPLKRQITVLQRMRRPVVEHQEGGSKVSTGRLDIWRIDPFGPNAVRFYPNLTQSHTREIRHYDLNGCDMTKRVIYLPDKRHNSATRGIGDRIIRLLSLAGLAGHIQAVVLPPRPFIFVGNKHNARLSPNMTWADLINVKRVHEKIQERTGWNPCGGIIQERVIISKKYPLIIHPGTARIAQWQQEYFKKRKLSPKKKKPLAVVVAKVTDTALLDHYQLWFNPFVAKVGGIFWYQNAGQLVHAVHSGAFPVSKSIVQAAVKAAEVIAPSDSRYLVSLKLRRGDMVRLLGEAAINCTKAKSLVKRFDTVMKTRFFNDVRLAQRTGHSFRLFIMSNEQDLRYLERFRRRLLKLNYVSSVYFEHEIKPFARMRHSKDEVALYLAALQLHRIATIRFVTFEHEVFADEYIFSTPTAGVIPAQTAIALCPNIFRNGRKEESGERETNSLVNQSKNNGNLP